MSLLKNIIRSAVSGGISKGIRNAVSDAVEKAVTPKAESYAKSVADSLGKVMRAVNGSAQPEEEPVKETPAPAVSVAQRSVRPVASRAAAAARVDLGEWMSKLAGFPVWRFGGTEFSIDENYTSEEGTTYYYFNAVGATCEDMSDYVSVLKADGFVRKYKDSDCVLYKDLGGEYLVFSSVEAFNDPDTMSVGMYRTNDKNDI